MSSKNLTNINNSLSKEHNEQSEEDNIINNNFYIIVYRVGDFAEYLLYYIISNKSIDKCVYYLIYSEESDKLALTSLKNDLELYNIKLCYYGDNYSKYYLNEHKNILFEYLIKNNKVISLELWNNFIKFPSIADYVNFVNYVVEDDSKKSNKL